MIKLNEIENLPIKNKTTMSQDIDCGTNPIPSSETETIRKLTKYGIFLPNLFRVNCETTFAATSTADA